MTPAPRRLIRLYVPLLLSLVAPLGAQSPYDARIAEKQILTPPPAAAPRLNGPRVYGARPGKRFVYRIPCQGQRPLAFTVLGLPEGLTLDAERGVLRGVTPSRPGVYPLTLRASSAQGQAERPLRLVIGERLALTPPTGWNSWGGHMLGISDTIVRRAADLMVERGLADVGFRVVGIDDCWMRVDPRDYAELSKRKVGFHPGYDFTGIVAPTRDAAGNILPNGRFPNMKAMTDYLHGYGLLAGLYSSPGPLTCQKYAGSFGHEAQDAAQYARWGFDLLKYDLCSAGKILAERRRQDPHYPQTELWKPMVRALRAQDRDILFNLCQYGREEPWTWAPSLGIPFWRTGGDLNHHVESYFDQALRLATDLRAYSKPGQWNDPDFLYIHKIRDHRNKTAPAVEIPLDTNQRYQYVTLWSLICAPFFFSCDITEIDDFTIGLLANADVLNINQDERGHVAEVVRNDAGVVVMGKTLADGSRAVGLFNRDPAHEAVVTVTWDALDLCCTQSVFDVWRQRDLGLWKGQFAARLSPNGVGYFLVREP